MDKLLETVMNFINENTTLLIIICVFLILVLIGYLIDNSIKTKKIEKQMANDENNVLNNKEVISNEEIPKETKVDKIDPNMEINLDFRTDEEKAMDNKKEEPISVTPIDSEPHVDSAINDLLLRDFANNNEVDSEEISINPINDIYNIEDQETKKEEPVVEESIYKNDKKLSDIFKKKSTVSSEPNFEKTEDYSNELDKILKKLNEVNSSDSTLDETQDFSNMF